jgi:hypothetical protein
VTDEKNRRALEVLSGWVVPIIVLLLIPIAGAFYVQDRNAKDLVYRQQMAGCHRGNDLREALSINEQALYRFITDAYTIRAAQAEEYRANGNVEQAALNQAAADAYEKTRASLKSINKIDCVSTIKHG